jgi:hypothetical protein
MISNFRLGEKAVVSGCECTILFL